jgi:AAA+ superfamily predicted ATPase
MSEQLILKNLPYIKILPAWAQELSYKYCSKTANLYIVHGNIRDFLPHKMNEGEFLFMKIQDYISEVLFGNRDIIVYYDRSSGIGFCAQAMRDAYLKYMAGRYPEVDPEEFLSADPLKAFSYLEKYFLNCIPGKLRIVLIMDYAETIVPAAELSRLSDDDRYCLVTLNRWSHDPIFTKGDVSIILLTENLTDISGRTVGSPSTIKVSIPIPDETVREQFLSFLENRGTLIMANGLSIKAMASITSGLNLVNLNQLAAESYQEDRPIDMEYLRVKKKEIIENEAAGLLEFLDTAHDLSYVSGHDFVKKRLRSATKALKQGRLDVLPMGYLIAGPVGTGKSFMVTAFAGEIGIPMVKFRNFRSKWQGVTESNLEKVLNILKAMSPVAVMIDEADAFLGDRNQDGDSGTSNRIFAQIASFMGNTEYRGRIIWFLITCRPDLLPIDLKRQGRAEEHLALFYPDSEGEKDALFETLVRKLDLSIRKFSVSELLRHFKHDFSGADLESVLIRAKFKAAMEGRSFVTKEDLEETMADFVPPAYPYEIELQNLVAVLECTSREMVPRRFQNLDRGKLIHDIQELKTLLGERG